MRSKLPRTSCSRWWLRERCALTSTSALRSRCCRRPQGIGSARNLGLHPPDHLTPVSTGVCHEQDHSYLARTRAAGRPVFPGDRSRWFPLLQRSGRPRSGHWQGGRGGIVAKTERVFRNLSAVLKAAGKSFDDVARVGVFLTSMSDYGAMNGIYAKHFSQPFPARTTIAAAALPLGACVEIDLVVKA